jgi:hypothetical protein
LLLFVDLLPDDVNDPGATDLLARKVVEEE